MTSCTTRRGHGGRRALLTARAEDGAAYAHQGRAFGHRSFEVGTHAHRQRVERQPRTAQAVEQAAQQPVRAVLGLKVSGRLGDAHQATQLQPPGRQRRPHRALRELFDSLRGAGVALDTLSMGMSADLEAAVAEGSTLVRVGSAIFGTRG